MDKSLQALSLYLTEKCNLNCSYCYIKKDFESTLDFKDIKKAVDIFSDYCSSMEPPTITILGGEPLMVYPLLLETIDYLNKKFDNYVQILLFTNGTLLTSEKAAELISKKIKIIISIDGIKKVNDCFRKYYYSPKISTFDAIIKNLKSLDPKIRSQIGVNMVVGPKTVPFLTRNIKFFQKLGVSPIDFSLLCYGFWKESEITALKSEFVKFAKFYSGLFTEKIKGNLFKIDAFEGFIRKNYVCDQMENCHKIKFATDKNFYLCDAFFSIPAEERAKFKVGDLKRGIDIKKIHNYLMEANRGLSKYKCESYLWHKKHRRVCCPFSIYFYMKLQNKNLKEHLLHFYRLSDIYTAVLVCLGNALKNNKKFNEFYFKNDREFFSDNL